MATIINTDFAKRYLYGEKCKSYSKAVDIRDHITFHFDGYFINSNNINKDGENPYFKVLIDKRRPSESDIIKAYRREVYLPKTKIPCHKVANSLKKIVKSQDWNIDYSKAKVPTKMPDCETLQKYCEKNYPVFNSLENWIYTYAMNEMLKDPNAVCVIVPSNFDKRPSDFYTPTIQIISSRKVIDFALNDYVVYFCKDDKSEIKIITTDTIYKAYRVENGVQLIKEYNHNIGKLPCFKIGGLFLEIDDKNPLYESFISPMLPELDAAAQDISDYQAEKVQHIFSTMWYYAGQECTSCNGTGKVIQQGKQVVCPNCEGAGVLTKSPYKDMMIKQPDGLTGEKQAPTPPAGYITKPTEMVELMGRIIESDIYNALSSINMEFLAKTPLNESGKAKEVDRDELNNFVYGVAYHICENILKPSYYFVNEWRYNQFVPNEKERFEMLPKINIPERFDLLTENIIAEEYSKAISGKMSDEVIETYEMELVGKRFNTHPDILERVKLKRLIDPLSGKSNEEKIQLIQTGLITQMDFVLSIFSDAFVNRAIQEQSDFLTLEFAKQKKIIEKYATEKVKELQPSERIKKTMQELEENAE